MRLLKVVLLVVLAGPLVGCSSKEDESASKDVKKTGAELQTPEKTGDAAPADKPETNPKATPEPAVDPPADEPPADEPPADEPPAVDPPVAEPPADDPPADEPAAADRVLDRKNAQKLEVRHSMIGFRNTLLFYTFKDQQAILTLSIGNNDETFPVKGKIHLFDNATTEEDLKKWINNQHSDGLFPEVPTPEFTEELPEGTCKVTSHKQTGTSENPGPINPATFKDYEVKLSVKEYAVDEKVKLSAFTDTALVHVKNE